MDGTLVPVHDRTITASSKDYRYWVNMQVVVDANARLVVAVGDPVPGNRNDSTAYRDAGADRARRGAHVMADGGHQGNRQVITPYRRPSDGSGLPAWQHELNTVHKRVHAHIEYAFAHMRSCATAAADATASTTPPTAPPSRTTWRWPGTYL